MCRKRNEARFPRQWVTPAGSASKLYLDMLEQPNLYILGPQTIDRDSVRDGFIYTALFRSPATIKFCFLDLCGVYLNQYKTLPHTIGYTRNKEEGLNILRNIYSIISERLDVLVENKNAKFPAIWVVIDGYEALHFAKKKNADNIVMSIILNGKIANVHLALFTSCIKSSGGIDMMFPSFGILNCAMIASAKFREIVGTKITTAPKEIVYKNVQGECDRIIISQITDEEISERINWWEHQMNTR